MDNFEEFIRKNREDLDRYEPSSDSWKKIYRRSGRRRVIRLTRYASVAAIVILAGISVFFFLSRAKFNSSGISRQGQQELKETEIFYNTMFNSMYMEAKPLLTGQPIIDKELREGAAQIDSICADLRKDLKDNVSNKEVVEALIRNYRIKIQLLEDMLNVVKQNENEDKKSTNHDL